MNRKYTTLRKREADGTLSDEIPIGAEASNVIYTNNDINNEDGTVGKELDILNKKIPNPPLFDGIYTLQVIVEDGVPIYGWTAVTE